MINLLLQPMSYVDIKKIAIDRREKEEIKMREAMNNMYKPKKQLEKKTL